MHVKYLTKKGDVHMEKKEVAFKINEHVEFLVIPIDHITVKNRIRSGIDMEGDSFDGLVNSICQRGVLEPIIVTGSGESYELICGERRLRACQQLGILTIPARIIDQPLTEYDRLEIELIENILRQDLNPINEADGYRRYFEERLKMNLDEAIKNIILYGWKDGRLKNDVVEGLSTIVKFSGKSSRTIQNLLKLLKLPFQIQDAIASRNINISLGGVFASHLDHPMLMTIFHACLKRPMTKEALISAFDNYEEPMDVKINFYEKYSKSIETIRQGIKKNIDCIDFEEAQNFIMQLNELRMQIESQMEEGEFIRQR